MISVDLAAAIQNEGSIHPSDLFKSKVDGVRVKAGRVSAVVWWWTMDLCHIEKPSLQLTNEPSSSSPWQQVANCFVIA